MSFMADIAMIGDRDCVLLAKAAGVDSYGVDAPQQAQRLITKLAKDETKVILITEDIYSECRDVIEKYKTVPFPAIIPIPDSDGTKGVAMGEIKANVEKAIGMDILFSEDDK